MKIIMAVFALCLSISATASYTGNVISVTGVPESSQTSLIIDPNMTEIVESAGESHQVVFFSGNVIDPSGVMTGFVDQVTYFGNYFSLNITEIDADNTLRIDAEIVGTFDLLTVSLADFSSPSRYFSSVAITNDFGKLSHFVNPSTGLPIDNTPVPILIESPLGALLQVSNTIDSVSFTLQAGDYNNDFSLLIESTLVPIPAAAWLFGSALVGLTGLRLKRS